MENNRLQSAFYDAIFESNSLEMNALEEETLSRVRAILDDPAAISSHIKPLPDMQLKLLALVDDPDTSFADFAELINQDPALAARVLGVVNSARYASVSEIKNLETAIANLGMDEIASITTTTLMEGIRPPSPIYFRMFGQQIWDHSRQCAHLCKMLCETEGESPCAGHFLGLIHDVGKILIFDCLCEALSGSNYQDLPGGKLFKEIMSEMSVDISYFISKEWELPDEFQAALQQQRTGIDSPLARILFKANACAELFMLMEKRKLDETTRAELLQEIDISTEIWESFLQDAKTLH